jgi:hypothetical protein
MGYLVFYGFFMFWFVATLTTVPPLSFSDGKKVGEVKDGRFELKKVVKPDLRKAA